MEMDELIGRLPAEFTGCYAIDSLLGTGAQGVVLRAVHRSLERTVVIKFLRLPDEQARRRFVTEARILAQIRHPSVVTMYDFGKVADEHYIILEYVPGETLATRAHRAKMTAEELTQVTIDVLEGLHELHSRGIIHRDIKPSNIWLTDDGSAKLLDFGIAKRSQDEGITRTGAFVGTPAYAAPEQFLGQATDGRTDMYSLGVVLVEVISGENPLKGDTFKDTANRHLARPIQSVSSHDLTVPAALENIILGMLQKAPDNRPSDIPALIERLSRAVPDWKPREQARPSTLLDRATLAVPMSSMLTQTSAPLPEVTPPAIQRSPPPRSQGTQPLLRRLRVAMVAMVGLVLILLFMVVFRRPLPTTTAIPDPWTAPGADSAVLRFSPDDLAEVSRSLDMLRENRRVYFAQLFRVDYDIESIGQVTPDLMIGQMLSTRKVTEVLEKIESRYPLERCDLETALRIALLYGERWFLRGLTVNHFLDLTGRYPDDYPRPDLSAEFRSLPHKNDSISLHQMRKFLQGTIVVCRAMDIAKVIPPLFPTLFQQVFNASRVTRRGNWNPEVNGPRRQDEGRFESEVVPPPATFRSSWIARSLLLLAWRAGQVPRIGRQSEEIVRDLNQILGDGWREAWVTSVMKSELEDEIARMK